MLTSPLWWTACLGLVSCVAFVAILFPAAHEAIVASTRRLGMRLAATIRRARLRSASSAEASSTDACRSMRQLYEYLLKHRWPIGLFVTALIGPSLCLLLLKGPVELGNFGTSNQSYASQDVVTALLNGEHLVPPAALPPEIFNTREVALIRPALASASRRWVLLDDAFAQRMLRIYQLMKDRHGYEMVLIEGYRSPERQNELAASGNHVTNAAAFQSYHQYGMAADSAFLRNGRIVISEKDPWAMRGYELFGSIVAEMGLTWGGTWTLVDLGHVEWRRAGTRRRTNAKSH